MVMRMWKRRIPSDFKVILMRVQKTRMTFMRVSVKKRSPMNLLIFFIVEAVIM